MADGTTLIAAALAAIGLVLFLSKPTRPINALLGVLLLLWAAVTYAFPQVGPSPDAEQAAVYARLTIWYSIPFPLVVGAIAVWIDGRPHRAARSALVVGAVVALAAAVAFAMRPSLFVAGVGRFGDGYAMLSGPLVYVLAATGAIAEGAVVWRCARVAAAHDDPIARRRAVWIGASLALPLLHAGAFFLVYTALDPSRLLDPWHALRSILTVLAAAGAFPSMLRLARELVGAAGSTARALAGVLLALGVLDGVIAVHPALFQRVPGYPLASVFVRLPVALGLATAALRFGLADLGRAERERLRRLAAACVGLAMALAVAAAAVGLLGANLAGFGVALVAGPAVPLLARDAVGRAAGALTRAALLPSDDPAAVAQRARAYAAALAASTGRDGRLLPEGERLLAQMRLDLGVTEREHELLLRGMQSRANADDALALGRYRLEEELAHGSTARVHAAVDVETGARVVVKRYAPGRHTPEVLREARVLAGIAHPRVLRMVEVDRRGDDLFLVTERAARGSARDELDATGALPPERAAELVVDMLDGLGALHASGLVHRDVKPENLLVDADGRGLVGDLGSAHALAADATLTGTQARGTSLSTVAPEVLRGSPATPRSDLYSAGATLYRLLTGRHYVELEDATAFEAQQRILLDAPRLDDPRVPPALRPVLARALAKRPEERFASAGEMRDAIAHAFAKS